MSINCTEVEESICKRAAATGTSKFVWATVKPNHKLNLPNDYKFHAVFMPRKYANWRERIENFVIRDNDIWITGFQKTGTTWIHNIVWQLKNNLNFTAPAKRSNDEYFETSLMLEESNGNEQLKNWIEEREHYIDQYKMLPSPRIFKSHLPAFLLPNGVWTIKPKVIYIARNPKDIVVSLYYMLRNNIRRYTGTLEEFCEKFLSGEIGFLPFFDHILSYWQLRHLDHVLFLTYEELSADQFGGVKRISEFLGCSYTDEQLKQLTEHVSFGKMREQFLENTPADIHGGKQDPDYRHCRKGKVGGYRDDLSEEMIKRFDDWMKEELKDSDFKFSL